MLCPPISQNPAIDGKSMDTNTGTPTITSASITTKPDTPIIAAESTYLPLECSLSDCAAGGVALYSTVGPASSAAGFCINSLTKATTKARVMSNRPITMIVEMGHR